jgi:bifunctional UDP-N-acetylglucosamine pyrophosphorylase/glucosamine-1-phosphate N-acetyltransferase
MKKEKRKVRAVILAAGKGTRMKGDLPKLAIEIGGKPIIRRVVEACRIPEIETLYVIVGHGAAIIKKAAGAGCVFVFQQNPLGTAHALMQVRSTLRHYHGDLVVVVGDSPFLTRDLVRRLLRRHQRSKAAATFLTTKYPEPPPYARVIRGGRGKVINLVEEDQCTSKQKRIREVSTSHYCFRSEVVIPLLQEISNDNPKHEYYLTDIIPILVRHGEKVQTLQVRNPRLVFGINDLHDLRWATRRS